MSWSGQSAKAKPTGIGSPAYYLNGSNQNIAETYPRMSGAATGAANAIGSAGVMNNTAIILYAGMVITNLAFRSGSTGTTFGSNNDGHWWLALYDTQATPALIAQTADQGITALGPSANFTKALSSPAPYTVPTTGVYYVSLMVNAGTGGAPVQPTISGVAGGTTNQSTGLVAGMKLIASTSGTTLAGTAPGTIASPASVAPLLYIATS